MGKSGSNEIKETEAQKAAAAVASEQWELYKNELQQYEDLFMGKVDELNGDEAHRNVAGTVALGTAQGFGEARKELGNSLAASGHSPTSGRYQAQMNELETEQALSEEDTTNRAQSSQQDRYVAGLKDVVSIGAGQKAEAMASMGDVAGASLRKAVGDAQRSFESKQATAGLIGTLAGAGTAYGLGSLKPNPNTAHKKISPTASVLQGKGY
ncbi:hypothetical protein ACEUAB_03170 [Aeromonas veronii]